MSYILLLEGDRDGETSGDDKGEKMLDAVVSVLKFGVTAYKHVSKELGIFDDILELLERRLQRLTLVLADAGMAASMDPAIVLARRHLEEDVVRCVAIWNVAAASVSTKKGFERNWDMYFARKPAYKGAAASLQRSVDDLTLAVVVELHDQLVSKRNKLPADPDSEVDDDAADDPDDAAEEASAERMDHVSKQLHHCLGGVVELLGSVAEECKDEADKNRFEALLVACRTLQKAMPTPAAPMRPTSDFLTARDLRSPKKYNERKERPKSREVVVNIFGKTARSGRWALGKKGRVVRVGKSVDWTVVDTAGKTFRLKIGDNYLGAPGTGSKSYDTPVSLVNKKDKEEKAFRFTAKPIEGSSSVLLYRLYEEKKLYGGTTGSFDLHCSRLLTAACAAANPHRSPYSSPSR